jgi:8-oxo-dGTP pyrophosphatase MutT (NUDIX family)
MKRDFDTAKELLVEDYRYRAKALMESERLGETRINIFVGFSSALLALLAFAAKERGTRGEPLKLLLALVLFALLVLGIMTLFRLIARDSHTDLCKRDLDEIRQQFKDYALESGLLFGYYPVGVSGLGRRAFGGLTHFMIVVNSLLIAGLVGVMLVLPLPATFTLKSSWLNALIALAAGAVLAVLQEWYVSRRHFQSGTAQSLRRPTHAGGVVFRMENNDAQYLVIRPKTRTDEWVLPKGHIKRGEGHAEAAAREVREEAAIVARPLCVIDIVEYDDGRGWIRVKYYLMRFLFESSGRLPSSENREVMWRPVSAAFEMLTHSESRYVLKIGEGQRVRSLTNADAAHH